MTILASVRLTEKAADTCAVTIWRDRVYLAWTAADGHIIVAWSADGRVIRGKQRLDYRSIMNFGRGPTIRFPPALAGSGARLWLAWRTGDGSACMCHLRHPDRPLPVTFEARVRANSSPSLTATPIGGITAAWTGDGGCVYLFTVTEDLPGESLFAGDKRRLRAAVSTSRPALCSHQGRLILAWTGTDRHINLASMP